LLSTLEAENHVPAKLSMPRLSPKKGIAYKKISVFIFLWGKCGC